MPQPLARILEGSGWTRPQFCADQGSSMTSTAQRLLSTLEPPRFSFGNAQQDTVPFHGWLLGHFVPERDQLRHSDDIEIKWGVHRKGAGDRSWTASRSATTISILVSGIDEIELPHQKFVLSVPGDYLIWDPGMPHRWRAVEDCTVVTVRWPSAPDDLVEVSDELVDLIRTQYQGT